MQNYYEILGIDQAADSKLIRTAYKKLAKEYHPDRNPGNKDAEEIFKMVNEAYHTLSDPLKKSKYDAIINPGYSIPIEEWEERRRKHYQRGPVHNASGPHYKIDRSYYRNQALAILAFFLIAGFCFILLNTTQYFVEQKRLASYQANRQTLQQASNLFTTGLFDDAFGLIKSLVNKDPLEYRIYSTRDSLMNLLRDMANEKFKAKDFSSAAGLYLALEKNEQPVSFETMQRLSVCQYALGNYKRSLLAMKKLHEQQPNNAELLYSMGMINLEKLNNPTEAMSYFSNGKRLFDESIIKKHGSDFETRLNPAEVPGIYFDIYYGSGQTNMHLKNFEEAVKDCNRSIFLKPNEGEPYKLRAIANASLGKYETVCRDIRKAKSLLASDTELLERKYCR